ncbi:long-chain fatty acid--CoA ligase [Saccharopolyspora erythraea]|uniref:acyl-CoA synthetase n=1 Tax=Saccharopolyspora erythraea TaxID=1836 RepID=UPI001BA878C5|nr:long-chain fatty acid--CoA ligase [Saccharopolyspora erythraea]QUH02094.1 long-chain fatty acid--CoA ligase [Saccharopolyspora erythraea]
MRDEGLGSWPARRARMTPGRVALVHGERRDTYAELARRTAALARGLRERGVRRGDRIGYLGPNHPAYLETLFASASLGAVFVPVNTRLAAPELTYVLADAGVSVLVHTAATGHLVDAAASPVLRERLVVDEDSYEDVAGGVGEPVAEPVGLDDPCLIMYTSGSTGRPKGVVLSHGNLTWNCVNVLVESDLSGSEVALVAAPLFHTAALGMTCLPTLLKGGTAVLMESFDPAAALELVARHRVTLLFGVPAMYDAIAAHPSWESADLSSVRAMLCGGSPVPDATIRRYLDRGLVFVQGYGMTETSPGVLILDPDAVRTKAGTAGVPSFFTDVSVVDPSGNPVAAGERGEIVVRGPNVMLGYWNQPDATDEALSGGWMHSGDVATVDEDGYITIVDRIKDLIISGGENVYPAEVESALHEHPAVELCAVVGVPDPKWGEVPRAVVVLRPGVSATADELRDHLRRHLAAYKVPKQVDFWDDLPRTGAGKVRKSDVRRRLA